MSENRIDVVSVLDRLIGNTRTMAGLTGDPRMREYLREGEQARDAIAELIELRETISDLFGIGSSARTNSVILANVRNVKRFAEYLHAIESEFFMVPGEPDEEFPDDEPEPECLLNCWGSTKEQYVEQFRAALARVTPELTKESP